MITCHIGNLGIQNPEEQRPLDVPRRR